MKPDDTVILSHCRTELWSPAFQLDMHRSCPIGAIIRKPLPGGQGDITRGVCACPCHAQPRSGSARQPGE